jgi:hypothetical protein
MEKPVMSALEDLYPLPVMPAPPEVERVGRVVLTHHHAQSQADEVEEERDRFTMSH